MQDLARVDDKATPAEVIHLAIRRTGKTLGLADPYAGEKKRWAEETTGNADWIRSVVNRFPDPFAAALRLSIASNILDCELRADVVKGFSIKALVEGFMEVPFEPDNVEDFRQAVQTAERILFIHDAAGEIFFDRVLIETFKKRPSAVVCAVRDSPILLYATGEDALAAGLDKVAQVIHPGLDCLGAPLNACSEEFREHYRKADVVVAKGQAAFETLEGKDSQIDGAEKAIFFLFRVKCPVLARHVGAAVGDSVLETG
jgi:hypothetical protein